MAKSALKVIGEDKAAVVTLKEKAREAALAQLAGLLEGDWDDIWRDMEKAAEIHAEIQSAEEKPKPFAFNIGAKVTLGAHQSDWDVSSEVTWSVRRKDASEPVTVSSEPGLFDGKE